MKKTRRVFTLFLAFVLMLSSINVFGARHAKRDIALNGIIVNGHIVYSDVEPYIKNSRTYVPIRFIAEELGYDVKWNAKERKVTMNDGETNVELKIGSDKMKVNDRVVQLDAPAEIKDGRTFVPLRAIAEAFGEKVDFSNDYRAVYIGDNPKYNAFYKVVYYYEKQAPVISEYTVNIATYKMNVAGNITRYETITELITVVYEDFYVYRTTGVSNFGVTSYKSNSSTSTQQVNANKSNVPVDKQLKDDKYVKSTSDPLVGSWYGPTTLGDTDIPISAYVYIQNIGNNRYKLTNRYILDSDSSSEFYTVAYATYYESSNTLVIEDSVQTYGVTGFFLGKNPYSSADIYILDKSRNRLLLEEDDNYYLDKY